METPNTGFLNMKPLRLNLNPKNRGEEHSIRYLCSFTFTPKLLKDISSIRDRKFKNLKFQKSKYL